MGKLLIGTSGYDYAEWRGGFYPEKLPQTKFLEHYATQFNSLELNGTYYRMPSAEQMRHMVKRTNGMVQFSIKAPQEFTHIADKSRYKALIGELKTALEPLQKNNVLLCVLFQFPQSFHYGKPQRLYLDALLKEAADIPVVVELRHVKWQNDNVIQSLRQRKVGWCITDSPDLPDLPKLDFTATSDLAYFRLHGRNADLWYKGDNVTRYDYLYSDEELKPMIDPIKYLLAHAAIVSIFFNNHAKNQATVNAKRFEMMLQGVE